MPKTDAERQQAWRDRRARLIATLKQENARLRDALTEAERLAAQQCKHQGGIRYTPAAAGIMVGLAAALLVSALIYAALR